MNKYTVARNTKLMLSEKQVEVELEKDCIQLSGYDDNDYVKSWHEKQPKFIHKIDPNSMHGECVTMRGSK